MKTTVTNCGNYKCAHCSSDGRCLVYTISIDAEGKCTIFRLPAGRAMSMNEQDEHTNMC